MDLTYLFFGLVTTICLGSAFCMHY